MDAGTAGSTLRGPRSAPPQKSLPLRGPKSCLDRTTGAVLPAGESPHRIDGIHGPGQGSLVGVYRGRSTTSRVVLESGTALPDRHLRFDSATESRFTSHLPAGSPFLAEARLQSLLDEAQPDPPLAMTTGSPAPALSSPGIGRSSGPPGPSRRVVRRLRTGLNSGSRQRVGWWHCAVTSTRCCPGPPTRCTGWSRSSCAIGRLGHRPAASIGSDDGWRRCVGERGVVVPHADWSAPPGHSKLKTVRLPRDVTRSADDRPLEMR